VIALKREHPEAMVTIHSGAEGTVNTWVGSGLCDLGLAVLYGDDIPGLRVETLMQMDCVVVLPKAHPLAQKRRVRAADLHGQDFISFPLGSAPRQSIDLALAAAEAKPRTVLESDLGSSVCALVAAGLGVSVINPLAAFEERRTGELVVRPLQPALTIRLAMLLPPDAPDSRLVAAFVRQVRKVVQAERRLHRAA
jgi:DNA-binding transcriptional LysR family regulator